MLSETGTNQGLDADQLAQEWRGNLGLRDHLIEA